jgi:hypothetical protein
LLAHDHEVAVEDSGIDHALSFYFEREELVARGAREGDDALGFLDRLGGIAGGYGPQDRDSDGAVVVRESQAARSTGFLFQKSFLKESSDDILH